MTAHDVREIADIGADIDGPDCTARCVVAVIVTWRGRVGLFKRSQLVGHDAGAWHCITGYLDKDEDPMQRAAQELFEETGLCVADLEQLTRGPTLQLADPGGRRPWIVHTFAATTHRRHLMLNWEHDAYRWVRPAKVRRFHGRVPWLADVLDATMAYLGPEFSRRNQGAQPGNRCPARLLSSDRRVRPAAASALPPEIACVK